MPNLYTTRTGEIVEEGDPSAAFLLHNENTEPDYEALAPEMAKALRARLSAGLKPAKATKATEDDPAAIGVAEGKAEPQADDKAVAGPEANKAKK